MFNAFSHEIIPTPDAERALGRSPASRRRDVKAGLVPESFSCGRRITGYLRSEIVALVEARIANASDDEIRQLVHVLKARRSEIAQRFVAAVGTST